MQQRRWMVAAAIAVPMVSFAQVWAQEGPPNGMREAELRTHAIVGATVVTAPGERIENATIVMRDGVIVAVGAGVTAPDAARVWSGEGLTVYPGLIDPAVLVSAGEAPTGAGAHWNGHIRAQVSMADQPVLASSTREELRELGFAVAAIYPSDGITRGTGMVVALADEDEHALSYDDTAMMAMGFARGGGYPSSLMGSIALMRQTLLDALWHAECRRIWDEHPEGNEPPIRADALAALGATVAGEQVALFDAPDALNVIRAGRIADEFDLDAVILGSGREFQRLREIVALDMPLIIPLDYPDTPSVDTLAEADSVSLRELYTWEQAPTNARRLADAGVPIAFTTHRLSSRGDVHGAVASAIQHGLDEAAALAALTTSPAAMLGLDDVLGTIERGKAANLVVVEGSLFDTSPKIRATWINGRRHEVDAPDPEGITGTGRMTAATGLDAAVTIDTSKKRLSVDVDEETSVRAKGVKLDGDRLTFTLEGSVFGADGWVQLGGAFVDGAITGTGRLPDGERFAFEIADIVAGEVTDDGEGDEDAGEDGDEADENADPVAGTWNAAMESEDFPPDAAQMTFNIANDGGTYSGTVDTLMGAAELTDLAWDGSTLTGTVVGPDFEAALTANVAGNSIDGEVSADGMTIPFSGARRGAGDGDDGDDVDDFVMPPDELASPLGAYGLFDMPQQQDVLFDNAVIWTSGPDGIIEGGSMLVRDGKIAAIYDTAPQSSQVARVDLGGRHVTPGLIDCHSHTGISQGINEGGQTISAEVSIEHVVNPDDVGWYRQLAGGLTAANQLHGSANPIGGQNSVVKLKWGGGDADFIVPDAKPGIKFALGENVVRRDDRYPNTRMGVETIIRDAFTAANEYAAAHERYASLPASQRARTYPPRPDLELETLRQIVVGDRIIHCHSYRQDEILMLIRVADDFGFTIGTFQHVLEGYKVADAIAAHGAGASSFSDWWAYKVEVMDAIPYNGSIMTDVGVNVSFNSDSGELARRMNTEASKMVRYGGATPDEALRVVTINPAIQMGIGHRTGSLEVGKDADFAIWSGDPLSTYTRCEQTWIEGAKYFDIADDAKMRMLVADERKRLVQRLLARSHGEGGSEGEGRSGRRGARRGVIAWQESWIEEQLRLGRDPTEIKPGVCADMEDMFRMMEADR